MTDEPLTILQLTERIRALEERLEVLLERQDSNLERIVTRLERADERLEEKIGNEVYHLQHDINGVRSDVERSRRY